MKRSLKPSPFFLGYECWICWRKDEFYRPFTLMDNPAWRKFLEKSTKRDESCFGGFMPHIGVPIVRNKWLPSGTGFIIDEKVHMSHADFKALFNKSFFRPKGFTA